MLESKSASGRTLLRYTYDKNNNIKTIKDITGKSSIYSYDKADRIRLIQDDNENNLAIYDYYKNDSIKSVTVGNGLKTDYTYDGDGNVQSLVTISSNGEVLVDYNYAYDLNGNRLQKVSSKHKNFYSYDSMNRLVDSSYDGRCESFTYDKVGSRLTKTTNDITEKYLYNAKNQLKELHNNSGMNHFTYDKQGNTIKEETETGNNIFEYNTLNQQVKAITKDGSTLVSRYDTEGLRAEIEENEKLTKFIFHKDNVLVEADKDYNVVSRFTRGYEVVADDIAESNEGSEVKLNRHYYTTDEQGSTVLITDKYRNIRNEYYYDAFGNVLDSKEQVNNRITYTGQQFDGITRQYYLRARFYNPVIGRFTQEDTYRGDGLNLYAYCENNPVGYWDPSGYGKCPKSKERNIAKNEIEVDTIPPEKLLGREHEKILNPRGSLGEKIPRSKIADPRNRTNQLLTREEKKIANQHLDDLTARRNRDSTANSRLSQYRPHVLTDRRSTGGDNFAGWTSLDLTLEHGSSNIMRLLYKEESDGIAWKVIQQH